MIGAARGQVGAWALAAMILGALPGAGCTPTTTARLNLPPLRTAAHVEVERYLGTWYEIAAFPQWFERGCTSTTATYSLRSDGQLDVLNRCRKGWTGGPEEVAKGRAKIVDRTTNAKLEVSFFRPFWGDYWIIDLGSRYEYAVVGAPGRDYLWILSRTPTLDGTVYETLLGRLRDQGYEVDRLVRTVQPGG
jgi:apolipoprotein D and lipocalin family protein